MRTWQGDPALVPVVQGQASLSLHPLVAGQPAHPFGLIADSRSFQTRGPTVTLLRGPGHGPVPQASLRGGNTAAPTATSV